MDDVITNIVQASFVCTVIEIVYRNVASATVIGSYSGLQPIDVNAQLWSQGGYIFFYSYLLCLVTQVMGFKDLKAITESNFFRSAISFLHGLDGMAAMLIGWSIYYQSKIGLWIGSVMITKFFLIHLLNRLILAKKSDLGLLAECTQTTKSFLHHVSSFLFICHPTEIILTTLWRTISMTGHATLVLRGKVSASAISKINWTLAYMRIFMVFLVLFCCFASGEIRDAFGRSAIGHISYMMVRAGPVYKTGSMYLSEKEKNQWLGSTEEERIYDLFTFKYFMLSLELALLLFTSVFFFTLKLSTFIQ